MVSTEEEPDTCYICLASEGEPSPQSKRGEPEELISPCYCSLKAHKSCLVNWVMETGGGSIKETPLRMDTGAFKFGFGDSVGLNRRRLFSSDQVKCAQCGHKITMMMRPSWLLNAGNFIQTTGVKLAKNLVVTSISSVVGGAIVVSLFSVLVSSGLKLFRLIAPDSVLLNLLNVGGYYKSFEAAIDANKVNLNQLFTLAEFPIYLYSVRTNNSFTNLFTAIYPFTFLNPFNFNPNDLTSPKVFLVYFEGIRSVYEGFFSLTFNRIYYRWVQSIRPFYLDGISEEEVEDIQQEKYMIELLESERLSKQTKKNKSSIFKRFYNWLFPDYSQEERNLIRKQRSREFRMIMKNDYTGVFLKKGSKLISTMLWPVLGNFVGESVLMRIGFLKGIVNKFVTTPDEANFILNCFGCLLVVVMKDLANLLMAYKQVSQYQNIEILHRGDAGFEELHQQEIAEESQAQDNEDDIDQNGLLRLIGALNVVNMNLNIAV